MKSATNHMLIYRGGKILSLMIKCAAIEYYEVVIWEAKMQMNAWMLGSSEEVVKRIKDGSFPSAGRRQKIQVRAINSLQGLLVS